ncbi:MAG: hypothetical protein E5W39_04360 [Mesorhizobium sp.]|nr:MAG: hypothetical protein E5W39_04360 [Mesorhizobium sp.]
MPITSESPSSDPVSFGVTLHMSSRYFRLSCSSISSAWDVPALMRIETMPRSFASASNLWILVRLICSRSAMACCVSPNTKY